MTKKPAKKPKPEPKKAEPKKKGRPVTYSPEIAAAICARIADGEGLRTICKADGMPPEATVRHWVTDDHNGFAAQYTRARQIGLDSRADSLRDISLTALGCDAAGVNAVRLIIETEKWYLSKIAPKQYGDRISHEIEDKRPTTPEARTARIAELMALGAAGAAGSGGV